MSIPSPEHDPCGFLRALFDAAVAQAVPAPSAARLPPPPEGGRTLALGAGKAAGAMVAAVDALCRAVSPLSGRVATRDGDVPPGHHERPGRIEVVEAAHPVPDDAGRQAALRVGWVLPDSLGACRAWGVEAKFGPSEDSFFRVCRPIAVAMGQKAGEKWTAAVKLQPTIPKPDRLLDRNDACAFFAPFGDPVFTGPTFTNVNDFRAILV